MTKRTLWTCDPYPCHAACAARPAYRWALLGLLAAALTLVACTKQPIAYKAAAPIPCDKPAEPVSDGEFPLHDYLPLPIPVLERKLTDEPYEILEAKAPPRGTSRTVRFTLQFRDCSVVVVKWSPATASARAYNNDPRKEIGAYVIQKLFLEPPDYVVPVTVGACVPTPLLEAIGYRARPQRDDMPCVAGPFAVWLRNVTVVRNFLDRRRFERSRSGAEPRAYARAFSTLNLFTYLIGHRDGRKGNFLVSTIPERPHIFSIDNDLAFSGLGNPRPFVINWGRLKVRQLPRDLVERLRAITSEQLHQHLGVLSEFRHTPDGRLKPVRSFSPNIDPEQPLRRQGEIVQLGLTRREIALIERRLQRLLSRIDEQEFELF